MCRGRLRGLCTIRLSQPTEDDLADGWAALALGFYATNDTLGGGLVGRARASLHGNEGWTRDNATNGSRGAVRGTP